MCRVQRTVDVGNSDALQWGIWALPGMFTSVFDHLHNKASKPQWQDIAK